MVRVAERSKVSVEDYLVWERAQERKHEYFDGEVYAMAGASPRHNALCMLVGAALLAALRSRCRVFTSDQRIRSGERRYVYPDISVVCGTSVVEHDDVIVNPTILVEVLSAGTELFDRSGKWEMYRKLASLTDYVLVSQDRARIEHFGREDGRWVYSSHTAGSQVLLTSGAALDIDSIFEGVFELKGDEIPIEPPLES